MRRSIIFLILLTVMLCGCSKAGDEILLDDEPAMETSIDEEINDPDTGKAQESTSVEIPEKITVYVCGAVRAPGVYELEADCRINAAVEAAGGFSEEADTEYVNLAARLQDGVKLQIPTVDETSGDVADKVNSFDPGTNETNNNSDNSGGLININTADKESLKTLPGIGDGIAGRIIEYREKNGSFRNIEDIMNVTGIKDKLFSKFKDRITV